MLHLIKMAAGISSVEELALRQAALRAERARKGVWGELAADQLVHVTRFFPKRKKEIIGASGAHGSLYWVFQRRIHVRQTIAGFVEALGEDGVLRCGIVLEGPLVAVERRRHRAFQGWRYLEADAAPPDVQGLTAGLQDMPAEMRRDLEELCLI